MLIPDPNGAKANRMPQNRCCSEVCVNIYIDKRLAGSIDCSVQGKLNSQSLVNAYNASSFRSILSLNGSLCLMTISELRLHTAPEHCVLAAVVHL